MGPMWGPIGSHMGAHISPIRVQYRLLAGEQELYVIAASIEEICSPMRVYIYCFVTNFAFLFKFSYWFTRRYTSVV